MKQARRKHMLLECKIQCLDGQYRGEPLAHGQTDDFSAKEIKCDGQGERSFLRKDIDDIGVSFFVGALATKFYARKLGATGNGWMLRLCGADALAWLILAPKAVQHISRSSHL